MRSIVSPYSYDEFKRLEAVIMIKGFKYFIVTVLLVKGKRRKSLCYSGLINIF